MKKYLAIACCVFLAACAAQPNVKKVETETGSSNPNAELLQKGMAKLREGSSKEAIENYFEPVIKDCESKYKDSNKIYFGARSPSETIIYAAMGSVLKKDVDVLDSTCGDAYFFKGFVLVDMGQLDEAVTYFEKATRWSPQNSMYLSELGNIYQLKKDWPKSLEYFEQAEGGASFSPDSVKNQELLRAKRGVGYNLTELGRLDESEKKYKECLAIDKNDKKSKDELIYIKQLKNK